MKTKPLAKLTITCLLTYPFGDAFRYTFLGADSCQDCITCCPCMMTTGGIILPHALQAVRIIVVSPLSAGTLEKDFWPLAPRTFLLLGTSWTPVSLQFQMHAGSVMPLEMRISSNWSNHSFTVFLFAEKDLYLHDSCYVLSENWHLHTSAWTPLSTFGQPYLSLHWILCTHTVQQSHTQCSRHHQQSSQTTGSIDLHNPCQFFCLPCEKLKVCSSHWICDPCLIPH